MCLSLNDVPTSGAECSVWAAALGLLDLLLLVWKPHPISWGKDCRSPNILSSVVPKIEPLSGHKKEVALVLGNSRRDLTSEAGNGGRMRIADVLRSWNERLPTGNWRGERTLWFWRHHCGVEFVSSSADG